ncbi:MAG: M20/M25/M40 family metallo-hydrolase [Chloroflexi bacterium]|nr:M20/M25/M40 family metallo-hydrolase [Chloroflexota bacterium]MCH9016259.1 M20/M25/M40 family metallo-hydrolase [Chloroflexota bacterium]MCI0810217.1 M20/M25/M40 family metallo-hydrolase [Chloroflexota bacterium]MCI0863239.1 M20/M25/M40 family metallo-hydrolase [Chloroflexota bacterium]MCI0897425.1 M20/M25/M40 family metallo-hydrolase [Chloroflexota bacterium]
MDPDAANRVLQQIDQEELVDLGKSLVRIPSFIGEETSLARWVASYLSARGYEVELQEVERGWFQMVATAKGSGNGPSLMFNGHLDINPLALGWTRDPFDPWVEGNRLHGAGIRNMKSGVASMIHAAEAIRKSGVSLAGDLVIACVLAELQGGLGTKHLLDSGYNTDAAVVTEPYGAHQVVTKHGGMTMFSLHIKGRHPSGDDIDGVDAILQMITAIRAIYDTKLTHQAWTVEGLPWLKIGSIIGGRGEDYDMRSVSRNSDLCTAFVAISTVPGMTAATIRTDLERTLDRLKAEDPGLDYQLVHPVERKFRTWILDHPPMDMPVDQDIVRALVSGYKQVTGHEPRGVGPPATQLGGRYGDDDAHLWEAGIPAPIYGPSGGSYGDDYADIDEMVLCSKVLALAALEMCG